MKLTAIILSLLFVPLLSFAQKRDTATLGLAYHYLEQNKLDSALFIADALVERYSDWGDAYDLRGRIYFDMDKRREALEDYTHAIKIDPSQAIYFHHRASVFYFMQRPEESILDNNIALSLAGANDTLKVVILVNRGSAKIMKRDFQGAYEDFNYILSKDSLEIGALINMGTVLDELGREDEALLYLEKAVRHFPDEFRALSNLGFKYTTRGDYQKAIDIFDMVVKMMPNEGVVYNNRAFAKYKLGRLKEAFKDVSKSLELYPQNSFALKNRALIYIAMGQKRMACEDLDKALEEGFTAMYGDEVEMLKAKHCLQEKL